jgi:hypothetical protein
MKDLFEILCLIGFCLVVLIPFILSAIVSSDQQHNKQKKKG